MPRQVSVAREPSDKREYSKPKSHHSEKEWTPVSRSRESGGRGSDDRASTGRGKGTGGRGGSTGGRGGSTGRGRGRPPKIERQQSTEEH